MFYQYRVRPLVQGILYKALMNHGQITQLTWPQFIHLWYEANNASSGYFLGFYRDPKYESFFESI